ncbi:MAG TPA: spermidine/putrescine ABC transporter substrate-binding protein [Candidatus Limnocylindrales bacterium]|nr:spermidine/putrescine ABC transporter substrate-binding protein [Candidatus Limnocylindrales bacterium]
MARRIWEQEVGRREILRGGVGLALGGSAALLAACGGSPTTTAAGPSATPNYPKAQIDGDLEWFNWTQYLSPDVIAGFEKQYGVKVNQHNFDNMQDMMSKLNSGIAYDITFPTMDFVYRLVQANALLPIDHTQLQNWKEVPTYFNNPWYDPNALYSVPYAIWTTGICWRNDIVSGMTGSWNDLWTLAPKYNGKIFLLDDFQETLGMSLVRLGLDINSTKAGDVEYAANEVLKIKPDLRGFSTDDITNLVNGSAAIHHAWSGDVYQVIQQVNNPQVFQYETCKEGVPTGNDTMVIPRAAQHPGTALKFIDWMLAPANATTNVKYFGYPQVTNTGLKAYQDNVASQYPFLALSLDQALHGLREIVPIGSTLRLWNQEWTKVKAG